MASGIYAVDENSPWMRKFIPVWSAQLLSLLGSGLVQFALVWWLTKTTGSAAILAMATLVAILPDVFLAPFIGALVDRWNRKVVMILADGAVALGTVALAVLFAFNLVQVWHVFVILFIRSVGGNFHWPAMQASTSLMVPEKHLSRIAGINAAARGALNIVAPPVAALLMDVLPLYGVISIDVVTAAVAIFILLLVTIPQPVAASSGEQITPKRLWKDVVEGFTYLRQWKGALYLLGIAMMINFLLAPSGTLMPLLVTKHFHGEAIQLGLIDSGWGIGAVAGGLLLGVWGGFKRRIYTSLTGVAGIGLGVLLMGFAPASMFWLAIVGSIFTGVMNATANAPLQAIMQARVAPEMQGRVFTMIGSFCSAMMPLAMLVAAPVAELTGVRTWFMVGGILTLVIGFGAFFVRDLRNIEEHQPEETAAPLVAAPVSENA